MKWRLWFGSDQLVRRCETRYDEPDSLWNVKDRSLETTDVRLSGWGGILDDFKPYLHQRWNQGVTNAAALHAEIKSRGWQGSAEAVRAHLRQHRPDPTDDQQRPRQAPTTPAPPKPRKAVRWITTHPDHLRKAEAEHPAKIPDRSPEQAATADHVRTFATMLTEHTGRQHLDDWLTAVRANPLPALHSLTNGIERDHAAIPAGLTLPYSSGAAEDTIRKIKFWKRLMFGRAHLDLLRKMALHNRVTDRDRFSASAQETRNSDAIATRSARPDSAISLPAHSRSSLLICPSANASS